MHLGGSGAYRVDLLDVVVAVVVTVVAVASFCRSFC